MPPLFLGGSQVKKLFGKVLPPRRAVVIAILSLSGTAGSTAVAAGDVLETIEVRETRDEPNEKLPLDQSASTASRLGLSVRETPGSISIIDRSAIEARGASDTQQILRGIPGVTASAPPGQAGFVSYRGFSASQITQLFNGITVQYDSISARPIDSWIYDRVEAVGGASGFVNGAGSVGGAINYITKLANRDGNTAQLYGSYGSNNSSVVAAGINRKIGGENSADDGAGVTNYLRIDLSRSGSDGYVDGEKRRSLTGAFSLLTDITPQLSHTLAYEYQQEHVDRPYWGTPLLNPTTGVGRIDPATRFKNYNANDGVYEQTVEWFRSIVDYRLSADTSIKNTFYHYNALRDYRNVEVYRYNATNTQVVRNSAFLQRHDQELTGNRLEWQHHGKLGAMQSDWAGGVDYSINRMKRFPRTVAGPISSVDPYNFSTESFFSIPGMTPDFVPDRSNRVTTLAAFLENRTRLLPSLSLVTGLRHDQIKLEVENLRTASATDPAYFSNTYRPTTGRAGLVWDITPSANVFVQYSTAADPPAGVLTTASFSQVRDFNLTTGDQVEAGSKFDFWDGRGNATISAYAIKRKNLAVTDSTNPNNTVPAGQQSSRGLEFAFGVRPVKNVRLQGNFSLVKAQYDDFTENVGGVAVSRAGKRPTNTPMRVANLWLDYAFMPGWNAGLDARAVSSVYGNTANTLSAPGYAIFGASLSYKIQSVATVTARVKNLTDKVYADNVTSAPMFYLGAPRTFEIAVLANF
ncbi:TonB-dependent receptor [Herbaspirillum rhizosphaerae]|uniref:TonB-dependent receptor n=1 Tax=Herbaspirillum rhizosphaerae TaxID=346179 RepID=UPI0038BB765F